MAYLADAHLRRSVGRNYDIDYIVGFRVESYDVAALDDPHVSHLFMHSDHQYIDSIGMIFENLIKLNGNMVLVAIIDIWDF